MLLKLVVMVSCLDIQCQKIQLDDLKTIINANPRRFIAQELRIL